MKDLITLDSFDLHNFGFSFGEKNRVQLSIGKSLQYVSVTS